MRLMKATLLSTAAAFALGATAPAMAQTTGPNLQAETQKNNPEENGAALQPTPQPSAPPQSAQETPSPNQQAETQANNPDELGDQQQPTTQGSGSAQLYEEDEGITGGNENVSPDPTKPSES